MVEVFKTDVSHVADARFLIDKIHQQIEGSVANFDLDDCDLILRIQMDNLIPILQVIDVLKTFGFNAVVLEDTLPNETPNEWDMILLRNS